MTAETSARKALLRSAEKPSPEQWRRFTAFLEKRYGGAVDLEWQKDEAQGNGFRMESGDDVFDWSPKGRLEQLEARLKNVSDEGQGVIPLIRETIEDWQPRAYVQTTGTVLSIEDGIAAVSGMEDAFYGEILLFEGGVRGMVQNLEADRVGCILFDDDASVEAGSVVYRTGKVAGVPVGDALKGRVVDALGAPIDGKGPVAADGFRPIESPAPDIVSRQPVNKPMETGLLTIDSMFPIGRGQRELIIGDRQTGKTAIALDTILNQKGKGVVCVYVAIGQKNKLRRAAGRNAAPPRRDGLYHHRQRDGERFRAAAIYRALRGLRDGRIFHEQGQDVLIVYDDLSKHAVAYRALSLLLGRSPGREAYPGDVFYLHSRLLERAAHLSDERGGGSMTALPIVETQAGDVSAYIPTNIISITDGQIYLESDLFFAGQRPAVNVGLSVSRVGGDAQTQAMKKAVGSIRLELAQYRELEVFTQFSSDLDDATQVQLKNGQALMRLLRQRQYHPFRQHEQVILLVAAQAHLFQDVPVAKIDETAAALLAYMETAEAEIIARIEKTGKAAPEELARLRETAAAFLRGAAARG